MKLPQGPSVEIRLRGTFLCSLSPQVYVHDDIFICEVVAGKSRSASKAWLGRDWGVPSNMHGMGAKAQGMYFPSFPSRLICILA